MTSVTLHKELLVEEDVEFGMSTVLQSRGVGHQINSGSIPYDSNTSVQEILEYLLVNGGGGSGGGGTADHGLLFGLSDDDHPQYLMQARGDARYVRLDTKGVPYGVTPLNASNMVDSKYLPWAGLVYEGGWNASSGTLPANPDGGDLYSITVGGTLSVVPPGEVAGTPVPTVVNEGELIVYSSGTHYWYALTANTAINDARYLQLTGGTVTGHISVPAGAAGSQAPRRSEIDSALATKANINSPAFTGLPTAPTQSVSDASTVLATTAFVHAVFGTTGSGGGGGVTDHGALTGLGDDDHTQYLNQDRGDLRYIRTQDKGVPDGIVPLNSAGYISGEYINISGLTYIGGWSATAGTLPSTAGFVGGEVFSLTTSGTLVVVPPTGVNNIPVPTAVQSGQLIVYSLVHNVWYLLTASTAINDARYLQLTGGTVTGHISVPAGASGNQVPRRSEIDTALAAKANLNSPLFTGTPSGPTAALGTNTTQLATTAFVKANTVSLDSPTFTGDPKAPTPATTDNDTSIATTAYVVKMLGNYAVPFTYQKATSGYVKFPSGIIMQWGSFLTSSSGTVTITYPLAFTSSSGLSAQVSLNYDTAAFCSTGVGTSTTQLVVRTWNYAGAAVSAAGNWLTIGY
jgi:hypothetical protein